MKAVVYRTFQGPLTLEQVPDPRPVPDGVILKVEATGLCRSDWHGWMGHDTDIDLPHVPGHELAGTIVELGADVKNFEVGDRVTLPFVGGCGTCPQCQSGNQQVCDHQFQPGFTHWGSYAEYVSIHYASQNLVRLPENMTFESAASLGCRFITSYRAVVHQGQARAGQWLAVFGCGGVGLSAIMIAKAIGLQVIAVDINDEALALAKRTGADLLINSRQMNAVQAIKELSKGGAHIAIDALGNKQTCYDGVACLRKRGKHIQVGLLAGSDFDPQLPMHLVVANELEIIGSHGMQAHAYPEMLKLIISGKADPSLMITKTIKLEEACSFLPKMDKFENSGITLINQF
jgi:alcohol dehydrogenase